MFTALKIADIRGIPIRLHISLLAVVALLFVRLGWLGFPAAVILFGSVLLHELGHSVVAQRFGIRIAGIDLHILGGLARMTRPPETPKQELLIAAAGPAVSLALAGLMGVLASLTGAHLSLGALRTIDLLAYGAALNLAMGVFNLVPALPMDGGRIFRALLAPRMGHLKATTVAAWVSRAFAVLFVLVGVVKGMWSLALIGGMLFLMVAQEERVAQVMASAWPRAEPQAPEWAQRAALLDAWRLAQTGRARAAHPGPGGPVIDVTPSGAHETREEFVDAYGRRYVVVTRLR
ncbi:MAG: site-2 protease family protein [Deltaproteobacteria bacterium]|nr:site-2 protease family protein [Deltaproteobacteria bacterium]